jgi:hypothetical protein
MKKKARHEIINNFKRFILVLSLLLISMGWVQAAEQAKQALNVDSDFITLYPNQFTDREKPLVEKFNAACKAIDDRGQVDVKALVAGKLPKDTPGVGTVLKVTKEMMLYQANKYDPENPVMNDSEYAKKLGYQDIFAYPTFAPCDDVIMPKFPAEARDKMLVGDLNHNITYYKPIYPGDTLYTVITKRYFVDATPKEGSTYRNICIYSAASIYNQKGEKVNDAIFRCMENSRQLKPGKVAISDGGPMLAWESPAWKSRPAHKYTDDDWAKIKKMWSEEKRQGATPLYWEDVKVGDYTTKTVDGPVMASVNPQEPYGMGVGGGRTLKKEIMDPATFKTMHKDENGIWLPADKSVYIPAVPGAKEEKAAPPAAAPAAAPAGGDKSNTDFKTADIHKAGTGADTRATLFNLMGRDMAIRNIDNWMGDKGWLYNIRWSIMSPTAMKAVGKTIPASPISERYVQRVPILAQANRVVNAHPLGTDLCIAQAYIEKKYEKDGKHFVDLVWWEETIDGYIFQEGGATVELPSKTAK